MEKNSRNDNQFTKKVLKTKSDTALKLDDLNIFTKDESDVEYLYEKLSPEDYDRVVYGWNMTDKEYPENKTIHEMFEDQTQAAPDTVAVIFQGQKLTYRELNAKSNQLARHLRKSYQERTNEPLKSDTLIALCLDRSLEMIIAIMAILKAGSAYVPIDPATPQDRIDYILEDTNAALILCQKHLTNKDLNLPENLTIAIDLSSEIYKTEDNTNLNLSVSGRDLAYVIYTSGTTGRPKGVMIEHRSFMQFIVNFSEYLAEEFNQEQQNVLSLTNYVFDIFGLEYALPLIGGFTITLSSVYTLKDEDLINVNIIQQTPSSLLYLVTHNFNKLKNTIGLVGGEALSSSIADKLIDAFGTVINVYGPAETVIWSSSYKITKPNELYIGKPLPNEQLYVLAPNNLPVDIGVLGELYIGGSGLARGYLNRPDLTAERFIANPFATGSDLEKGYDRLYKTGDLVRWLPDGNLEYVGRNDDQVKIGGHRIELGEIAHSLSDIEGIQQSCVLVKERNTPDGTTKFLVAYYVLDHNYVSNKDADILESWESLYDADYELDIEDAQMESDFSVWTSYITGKPIPAPEMEEWRNNAVDIIKKLNTSTVLEIGVGSGLLMYPLLSDTKKYVGLDISKSVINRHLKYLEGKNHNTALYHLKADQIDELPQEEVYDTIIINSVCQYFPSIKYFEEILEKSIQKLSDNGSIFLGDIRNYDLHKELIKEKFDYKGENYDVQDILRTALKENELLISPNYFNNLKKRFKNVEVTILDRVGGYVNELSKYRFDVIISFNGDKSLIHNDLKIEDGINNCNTPFLNQLSKESILNQLSQVLPAYMLPLAIVAMESFPLTVNGKLDKRSLPDPDFIDTDDYVAPTTEREKKFCEIWAEVLGLGKVGITDNFFRIGGNSILAIQVSHRISKSLELYIKVSDIFKYKTIVDLINFGCDHSDVFISKVVEKENIVSFAQERLWFIEQYEEGTHIYHIPAVFELEPETDSTGIKYALQQIISRHEVLRSTIKQGVSVNHGIQIVHQDALIIEETTISGDDYRSLINKDINSPFNLSSEYPIRVKFYHTKSQDGAKKTFLLICTHHIASDGWSIELFQKELVLYYESFINNDRKFKLPSLEIQYKDYAAWQRSYLTGEVLAKQLEYWKLKLSNYQILEFPTDHSRPAKIDYKGANESFSLTKEISDQLRFLAQKLGVSLHSVMLTSINILLSKYTGQDDIVIGSPIANRQHRQTEDLIGFFVNVQVNRTVLKTAQSFESLIDQVHEQQIEAQFYQDLPFEMLVDELHAERDITRHPIFQILFVVESFSVDQENKNQLNKYLKQLEFSELDETAKFDLSILIDDSHEALTGKINYATGLFEKETIKRFITYYQNLLDQLIQEPQKDYSEIGLLPSSEYNKIINDWNSTEKEYPKQSICKLFENQAFYTPDAIALIYDDKKISYKELNEKSNQLAHYIRGEYYTRTQKVFSKDTFIILCLDKGPEMIIAMLAILKAGGAYVPVDTDYPQERIDYIIKDTNAELILVQNHLINKSGLYLPEDKVVSIDLNEPIYKTADLSNLDLEVNPKDLAYVIYTSGTTGVPKGVIIDHDAVLSLIFNDYIKISKDDVFAFLSSPVFDAATFEIWTPLLKGNLLVIPSDMQRIVLDVNYFSRFLKSNNISIIWLTKTLFENLYYLNNGLFENLNFLIIGGEALDKRSVNNLINSTAKPKYLLNGYGPTESTTFTCTYTIEDAIINSVPIGKPINNRKVYVLDSSGIPVAPGVTGELYIGGSGLARGYLNRADLTRERFVANPFATASDTEKGYTRLYKTGDLVRWLSDGTLEYIGRNDDQVKIRGYRIEPGEIEHAIAQLEGIQQVCVVVKERITAAGSDKYLAAYYILSDPQSGLNPSGIQEKLLKVLPDYMVPAVLIALDSFPLTINGKLDKRALPDADFSSSQTEYTAPLTAIEKEVCEIWENLLGIEQAGMTDNFFKIGGNSILAIQVSHRMSTVLGCDVKVADVFKYKTIAQLLAHVKGDAQLLIPQTDAAQGALSFAQERLWFIEQYEQGTNAYHIPVVFELDTDTDKAGIKYALQQIVSRHEVLRSTIEQGENQQHGIQNVHDAALSIQEIDVLDTDDYDSLIRQEINRPFDLGTQYPIRVGFYTIKPTLVPAPDKILLCITTHHIASDGWSVAIFEKELWQYYQAYKSGDTTFRLPDLEIQYKDYAAWQRTFLTGTALENQLSYWKGKLAGYQTLELPVDHTRPTEIDYRGSHHDFILDKKISSKLRELAQQYGLTLNSVMLGSMNILLGKYTGQDDIVIGSAIANRHHRQTEGLIGFFVNTQANRTFLNATQSFAELIQQVHQDQIEAQLHQDLPFEKLIDELGVERDASRHPVFQVMFGVQNFEVSDKATDQQKSYLKHYLVEDVYEVEKFDLSVFIDDSQEELSGHISYATSLFDADTIAGLSNHYIHLLDQLTQSPNTPYSEMGLLDTAEYQKIVYDWNATAAYYPEEKTLQDLFVQQAQATPFAVALVYENRELTYGDLNEKSNQLAREIREQYQRKTGESLKPDTLIALYLERSLEMVIAILAVLKSGGAYVPIDPGYPQDRIDYILEDTQAELILIQRGLETENQKLPQDKLLCVDLKEELYELQDKKNLPQYSQSTDLAYVIYTSGTTGKPKGVMIEHKAAHNTITDLFSIYDNQKIKKVTAYTSYVFDVSVSEIFSSLLQGLEVHILSNEIRRDTIALAQYFSEHKINLVYLPPVLLGQLPPEISSDLITLIYAGEPCDKQTAKVWSGKLNLYNYYGPTEASIYATGKQILAEETEQIGKPIQNAQAYVLDSNGIPVAIGVAGELYIGGSGLARGYLNRPDLTQERFVANPFATASDLTKGYTRLYKTGDLVRWLADGNLEYLGRNDDQVKIRGYRIELGEIEHAIAQLEEILQVCVVVKERITDAGSYKYLAAYYILNDPDSGLKKATIQEKLSKVLPDYMVPRVLIAMGSFPLTINGKLDKRALPDADFSSSEQDYIAPSTVIEREVCEIWENLLGIEQAGMTDNFFKIGGNSILAIQVSHLMSKALGCDVKVADVFKCKTIAQLLAHVQGHSQLVIPHINTSQASLSFAQERLWFIEQYEQGTSAYHVPVLFELDTDTDKEAIKYALQQIVSRHEVLRSTIEQSNNEEGGIQVVHETPLSIDEITLQANDDYNLRIKEDINRPFKLNIEYPIRAAFYSIKSTFDGSLGKTVLLINTHHIASDGWSMDIFQKELRAFYDAYINKDLTFSLPSLEIQYKDYALWQRSYLTGEVLEIQLRYWKNKLSGYQTLEFPTDYVRTAAIDYSGASHGFTLNKEIIQQLRLLSQRYGVTLNSIIVSSVNILLGKYTRQEDIVVGSPIANRHHRQTENLIGFFVNTQVNRTLLSKNQSFGELVYRVHQDQVEAQLHQDLPFERLVNELVVERDLSRHPIFQVMIEVQSLIHNDKDQPKKYFENTFQETDYETSKFDLSIDIKAGEEELTGEINYATSLFKKDTIKRFTENYIYLLEKLLESPDQPYSEISLLKLEEYQQVITEWNNTDTQDPEDKTINILFEEQVLKTPDHIAIVFEGQTLSYKELNEKSNQLAHYIRTEYEERTKQSLKPDTIIALCLDRSLEMVISIIAVLKAGGAYVPIDPGYPQDRIEFILEDTKSELLLTQRHLMQDGSKQFSKVKTIYTDLAEEIYNQEPKLNLPACNSTDDLAYVIYTSGTTGKPKGVLINNGSVVNLINFHNKRYSKLSDNLEIALLSNYIFDFSVQQIFNTILYGHKLHIIPGNLILDPIGFNTYLKVNKIEVFEITPVLFSHLILPFDNYHNFDFKLINIGGEHLSINLISEFLNKKLPSKLTIINTYGPTEYTVDATSYEIDCSSESNKIKKAIPIGKPLDNTRIYILDQNQIPVAVGVIGELYLGGAGLARGYLNRPELTAERFVENPFATDTDKTKGYTRLYKTGDLVRWLSDGNIEYIGREDDQVKINGYRIELEEVEKTMSQIKGIKQVCVLTKERKTETGNANYLVGYYVLDNNGIALDSATIQEKLLEVLPDYMVPTALIAMENFPLTINGKLDRRALPDPDFSSSASDYVAPTTDIEKQVCAIWMHLLGLDQVGITDDFFRIGGNSILAIQVSHRMSKVLGCDIKVGNVFKFRTISLIIDKSEIKKVNDENISFELSII